MPDLNVLGTPLEPCGSDPLTGFYRDGCCTSGPEDIGMHTICAVMTAEFLEHQGLIGNDLSTPRPEFRFPGLMPGDRILKINDNFSNTLLGALILLAIVADRARELFDRDAPARE